MGRKRPFEHVVPSRDAAEVAAEGREVFRQKETSPFLLVSQLKGSSIQFSSTSFTEHLIKTVSRRLKNPRITMGGKIPGTGRNLEQVHRALLRVGKMRLQRCLADP